MLNASLTCLFGHDLVKYCTVSSAVFGQCRVCLQSVKRCYSFRNPREESQYFVLFRFESPERKASILYCFVSKAPRGKPVFCIVSFRKPREESQYFVLFRFESPERKASILYCFVSKAPRGKPVFCIVSFRKP